MQAAALYSRAVDQQDSNAYDRLGLLYLHGLGIHRSPGTAFKLFTEGAKLGDSWAQLNLGQMYQSGHVPSASPVGVGGATSAGGPVKGSTPSFPAKAKLVPDYAAAVKLYTDSAAQGNRVAAYKLGELYATGLGVHQDYVQALEYYKLSASQRFAPALAAMGRAYELGEGTVINLPGAYVGYSLAAELGDPIAGERLQTITHSLSAQEMGMAQAMLKSAKRFESPSGDN
jgi:TPR repeat protein